MRTLIAVSVFVVGAALTAAADPPPSKSPPDSVEEKAAIGPVDGGYVIISGERGGKPIPESEIKDGIVRFTLGEVVATDKDRMELLAATFTVDASKKPWKITMKNAAPRKVTTSGAEETDGTGTTGLVKKEGDTLTLIYALPGGEAPTEFKTKANQQMFVMRAFIAMPPGPNKFATGP
jgi:uncharacterized protein (TIGR03067 family)